MAMKPSETRALLHDELSNAGGRAHGYPRPQLRRAAWTSLPTRLDAQIERAYLERHGRGLPEDDVRAELDDGRRTRFADEVELG